jgi:hypothetical protein
MLRPTLLALLALLGGGSASARQAAPAAPAATGPTAVERQPVDVAQTIDDAVAWLVANQAEDGSWGSHHSPRPIEVLASIPGSQEAFRVATTALCVTALQECPRAGEAGARAVEKAIEFLVENYDVKRQSGLEHYNVWSFGYTLQAFGERLAAQPEHPRAADMRAACEHLMRKLVQYQTLDGGWGYLSIQEVPTFQPSNTSMSFTTATILVGLDRARAAGVELPEEMIERAVDHVLRSRLSDGAFLYGEYLKFVPRHGINQRKGSACRNPLCHYALDLFGEAPAEDAYVESLRDLLVRHAGFQKAAVRRPIPHESWYAVSGYFYLYGHAYAAYVLQQLPEAQQRALWPTLVEAVMVCHQPDGSFWDYPLYSYHKPYGTAFALIALTRALEASAG